MDRRRRDVDHRYQFTRKPGRDFYVAHPAKGWISVMYTIASSTAIIIPFNNNNPQPADPPKAVPPSDTLRPYQTDVIAKIEHAIAAGDRRIILVAPTGSGKTIIAAEIAKRAVEQHHYVLFLAHRREIIQQTRDKLIANGLSPGIVQAGLEKELRLQANVQVCAIQTLWARAMRSKTMPLPPGTVLIIDEAHHSRAHTYQKIIAEYPDAVLYGLTATPCRGDGRGLGNVFDTMIECPQVAALITGGYLVKSKVYAPIPEDIAKGVKTQSGDYIVSQLAGRMNTDKLVGDIVTHWHKYGANRATVVFGVDVAHSVHIKDEFVSAGVRAEHLDGSTSKNERDAILARLRSGETKVVSNCMVLTEGFDCPDIGCIILARPTKQMGLFRQMIGRGLRPAPGKTDLVILDHSGAVYRHGLPEDHVHWTLDVDRRAENQTQAKRKAGEEPKLRECPKCSVLISRPPCGSCGWVPAPRARDRDFLDGELGLVIGGKAQSPVYNESARTEFFQQLRAVQQMRGYKKGWAAHKFKDKFGTFPPWSYNDLPPHRPTNTVLAHATSPSPRRGGQHEQAQTAE
jgi:DNA repair protein RadD